MRAATIATYLILAGSISLVGCTGRSARQVAVREDSAAKPGPKPTPTPTPLTPGTPPVINNPGGGTVTIVPPSPTPTPSASTIPTNPNPGVDEFALWNGEADFAPAEWTVQAL